MAKNPFRATRNANRAQAQILRGDTKGDFKVTQQGLDAILANLTTTQTGLGRKLTRVNARGLEAMGRMSARSNTRMNRIVNQGESMVDNRFGTVVGSDPNLFAGTKRLASSQKKVNAGQVKAGELQARGANEAMDILAAAGQTAMDSGQYELAMALRDRQGADAEVIAASKLALQQQKLEAANQERYLRLQTRLQGGGTGGVGLESALAELGALAEVGPIEPADISRLAAQYNLGPQAIAQLKNIAAQYGSSTAAGSPAAQAFTESNGLSPAEVLNPSQEKGLNAQVWAAFDPAKPAPSVAEALRIAGIEPVEGGSKYMQDGTEIPEQAVQAAIAYVQSTWIRIAGQAGSGATGPRGESTSTGPYRRG